MDATVTLTVNGTKRTITTNPERSLLDVLREELHLTGTKYGCGEGQCGACTVLMDGKQVLSCITPVAAADKKAITTIEGLAAGDSLHPVQEAFLAEGAMQCGYCTSGMILTAVRCHGWQPVSVQRISQDTECNSPGGGAITGGVRFMSADTISDERFESERCDYSDESCYEVQMSRRSFVQLLGAGLLITVTQGVSLGQRSRGRDRQAATVAARLHINQDGTITVMTGKVEEGQGARAQLTQAAAEELRVAANQIRLVMADTELVPDDGITAGSRTTPRTVPAVRRAAATARELLTRFAAEQWAVDPSTLHVRNSTITHQRTKQTISYADLAKTKLVADAFTREIPDDVTVIPVAEWKVLGTAVGRPNWRDLVTGAHRYPSDIVRPNMLYAKILRPPSYGATLESIDLSKARAMKDVVAVHDGQFVGFAAPSAFRAEQALKAVAESASWKTVSHISSRNLFSHLKSKSSSGGRSRSNATGSVDKALAEASKVLTGDYEVAYVQHAPMEPRAAVAEWKDGRLTVWAGIDWPQRIQRNLAETFSIASDQVRVIVPDMGGGFGGKHTGEAAEEAARLAKAAKRPVSLRWTRAEEFTWAYFRPAGVIEVRGGLSARGSLTAWDFTNINSGGSAIDPPYEIPNVRTQYLRSDSPLRQGAYRCGAITATTSMPHNHGTTRRIGGFKSAGCAAASILGCLSINR
jgi:isoquinoline 1-oxidoreductase